MKFKTISVWIVVVLAISASSAQQPNSQAPQTPEDAIVRVEEQWLRAVNEKDRKTLDDIMADDFIATTPIGEVLGKSKLVPPDRPPQGLPKYHPLALVVKIDGDTAVLMARLAGEGGTAELSTTAVFKEYGQQWKIIAMHLSPLPK